MSGGITSYITGGDPLQGAAQGLVVYFANHLAHLSPDPPEKSTGNSYETYEDDTGFYRSDGKGGWICEDKVTGQIVKKLPEYLYDIKQTVSELKKEVKSLKKEVKKLVREREAIKNNMKNIGGDPRSGIDIARIANTLIWDNEIIKLNTAIETKVNTIQYFREIFKQLNFNSYE